MNIDIKNYKIIKTIVESGSQKNTRSYAESSIWL